MTDPNNAVALLRKAINDVREAHKGPQNLLRYPQWVYDQVAALVIQAEEAGKARTSVAKLLGLPNATLLRMASKGHRLPPTALLKGKDHVDSGSYRTTAMLMTEITITTPHGLVIKGLTLDQAIRFTTAVERNLVSTP